MVVDANAAVRRMIEQVVGDLAKVICECATPLEAFTDYRQFRSDVVVMDRKTCST